MAIQSKFRTFDENIKLKRFEENAELREKRDRVLNRLREGLERQFPTRSTRPTFDWFNQGSYEMGTGVKPVNGDYDIDVGLVFDIDKGQHDPVKVKEWVYEAVKGHTTDVRFRRPCITVYYVQSGEAKYHVDLAVYAKENFWGGPYLAIGKQNSGADHSSWQDSSPKRLTKLVAERHSGDDAHQFRRVIRYLKRWKDQNFSLEGYAAPRGIALTACAYRWFESSKEWSWSTSTYQYHDLRAVKHLVSTMVGNFSFWNDRLSVTLPVPPENDLFEKMSDQQMKEFKARLVKLRDTLASAENSTESEACRLLRTVFGTDFPT